MIAIVVDGAWDWLTDLEDAVRLNRNEKRALKGAFFVIEAALN
jgi:hypothetical protein